MQLIDIGIIILYFLAVIGLGFWYQRRASKNLESYFLGGKSMHWLALAMSGSVSNFDITGTMWIVSILFVLGMKSMWHHWMWGVMMGAFFLAFMGKWVRRSQVMTAAEWMVTRFGNDTGGVLARTSYALMAIITLGTFIGYAFQGIGKFADIYLPMGPTVCAIVIIAVTTLYVLLGGLYSVVFTQVLQTILLTLAGILITGIAYFQLSPELIADKLPAGWTSLWPTWRLEGLPQDSAHFEFFGALVVVWVLKGFLLNAGGPAQMYDFQLFLASRDPRDGAKVGAAWSFFLIIRWAMVAGITLLALVGISAVDDPEQVMPIVLQKYLPVGLRGLVIAGLLAAFMSTFSATVNAAASFVVRDLVQPMTSGETPPGRMVLYSRIASLAVVIAGCTVGYQVDTIADIWNWIMMALGGGVIMPNVLRWYWWRMNGWGYAAGTLTGIVLALIPVAYPSWPIYYVFPIIALASLAACIIGSYVSAPVNDSILVSFYRTVRPFGLWKRVRQASGLSKEQLADSSESAGRAAFNTLIGMVAVTGYYLFPMYLVGHWHWRAGCWLAAALVATVILAVTWYPYLPAAKAEEETTIMPEASTVPAVDKTEPAEETI